MVREKEPGTLRRLTSYLTEPVKFVGGKAFDLYTRAYEKHPRLTSAITLAATVGTGCLIGNAISPPTFVPQPVNLGFPYFLDPSKWEIYQAWAPAGAVFGGIGGVDGALVLYCAVRSKIER